MRDGQIHEQRSHLREKIATATIPTHIHTYIDTHRHVDTHAPIFISSVPIVSRVTGSILEMDK